MWEGLMRFFNPFEAFIEASNLAQNSSFFEIDLAIG